MAETWSFRDPKDAERDAICRFIEAERTKHRQAALYHPGMSRFSVVADFCTDLLMYLRKNDHRVNGKNVNAIRALSPKE